MTEVTKPPQHEEGQGRCGKKPAGHKIVGVRCCARGSGSSARATFCGRASVEEGRGRSSQGNALAPQGHVIFVP